MAEPDGDPASRGGAHVARGSPPARPSSVIRRPYLAPAAVPVDPPRRSPTDPLPRARRASPLVCASPPSPSPLVSRRSRFLPLPQDASPAPPPRPPPRFDLDWRALAVVVEAGSPGVDAAAVQTALLSAPDEHVHDGRTIVFGALSFEELRRDAADAEEDSPLHAVHVTILAHQESHVRLGRRTRTRANGPSPSPSAPSSRFAKSRVDAAAHKAEVTAKRQAAVVAARRGGRRRRIASRRRANPSRARRRSRRRRAGGRHAAPRSTPASRGRPRFQTAKRQPRAPWWRRRRRWWRRPRGASRPAKIWRRRVDADERSDEDLGVAAKVYALADDLRGEDGDALADLTAAGFPARAVLNVARARLAETDPGDDDPELGSRNHARRNRSRRNRSRRGRPVPSVLRRAVDVPRRRRDARATSRIPPAASRWFPCRPRDEDTPDAMALARSWRRVRRRSSTRRTSRGANPPPSFACRTPPA